MLRLIIPGEEFYNEEAEEFVYSDDTVVELEHSLVSLSKWESIFEKPFLGPQEKTSQETLMYIECMILEPKIPGGIVQKFDSIHINLVNHYINSNQSATTFGTLPEQKHKAKGEIITSELIYYWMVAFNIPFECETWHLNRLFSLIKICNLKQGKQKKMSRSEIIARNRALNAERRAKFGTKG